MFGKEKQSFCFKRLFWQLKKGILFGMLLLAAGCAGTVQPYSSKFKCPPTYGGLCEPMEDAYQDSVHEIDPRTFDKNWVKKRKKWEEQNKELIEARKKAGIEVKTLSEAKGSSKGQKKEVDVDNSISETAKKNNEPAKEYRQELFKELRNLIAEPETPLVVPPKVIRILVLSTVAPETNEKSILISPHYVYFMLDSPRWILHKFPEYVPFDPQNPMIKTTTKGK